MTTYSGNTGRISHLRLFSLLLTALLSAGIANSAFALTLDVAKWNASKQKLIIKGTGDTGEKITIRNANDPDQVIGRKTLKKSSWTMRKTGLNPVPCAISVTQTNSSSVVTKNVANRPADCDGANPPTTTTTTTSAPTTTTTTTSAPTTTTTTTLPVVLPDVSINSTSQNGIPAAPVDGQPLTGQSSYKLFSANDLGMHCGDFDTRISSILPPFQVVHTQVILRGSEPDILTPDDGIEVVYSASSNPDDPILTGVNSAGTGPVLSSMLADGSVYKTNFWAVARNAYDPFYPEGILPAFYPAGDILDLGLPMPNVEQLYLGDGNLTAVQQEMPGRLDPYVNNDPLTFNLFTLDQPFFTQLPVRLHRRRCGLVRSSRCAIDRF